MNHKIVVYGSYGYTGSLIVEECKRRNFNVILSGRDEYELANQHNKIGFPYQRADINKEDELLNLLNDAFLVIHCAGPFQFTARQMVEACLATKTHYLDITGEYEVFELIAQYGERAKVLGIQLMPGVGFDVVPSDCLALHLKQQLPDATHLQLAFTSTGGGFSRGTAKTMVEGLGRGSTIRRDGTLTSIQTAEKVIEVDFGSVTMQAVCIPWGDIATAWRSTGIPNIEVYLGAPDKLIKQMKISRALNFLFKLRPVKNFLKYQIDNRPAGPSEQKRKNSRSLLWGKVWNEHGITATARLETLSGYELTYLTAVMITQEILKGNFSPGYQTPAMVYGADFIVNVPTTIRS